MRTAAVFVTDLFTNLSMLDASAPDDARSYHLQGQSG